MEYDFTSQVEMEEVQAELNRMAAKGWRLHSMGRYAMATGFWMVFERSTGRES